MSKTRRLVQFAIVTATMLLAACATTITSTPAPAVPLQPTSLPSTIVPTTVAVQPTIDPVATRAAVIAATALPVDMSIDDTSLKIGLVTDVGGVNDHAYNQLAWEGMQQAAAELEFEVKFIESRQPADYEANIDALAAEGTNVIITVGSLMADATALKARQYPTIQFAIIDHAYVPTNGSHSCADTVSNCYADGGLTNVVSLMFAEDQLGFLAGVLAGGMSNSSFVCSVTSVPPPASDRYIISFRGGAAWQGGDEIRGMNNYINIQTLNNQMPNFTDPTEGQDTAQRLIGEDCDVVFGVDANGALRAAQENNVMAIGADVDQYNTVPEAQGALLSSAQKNVDVAVYNYLRTVVDGSVTAGISTGTLQNGSVGLAPFHDWDSRIPAELKAQIQRASDGIMDGSIAMWQPE